ncbi:MAG TPA: ATP-binding cassette domain-containing protein [Gemmatimonadaceae bacterium]|nr:ATP-binding cassette domain-containing protein [Gemmatimonadaceae bacterium]
MTGAAILADGLAKQYAIGSRVNWHPTIREAVSRATVALFRLRRAATDASASPSSGSGGTFWALRDVSFEIGHGEVTGIVGRNGAGKSTLLKILSRITRPTEGRAVLHGRVGSLLEVGTGFHPELTGRENVFLNGAILGMSRADIVRKLDEIVAFAEIATFLDTPVKHYSSGMYLRLAFAVAAHLEPEIMLVDEVLAVGDASFQRKCLGKMGDVARSGRTVVLVSHNLDAIVRLCPRSLLIENGRLAAYGETTGVIARYLSGDQTRPGPDRWVELEGTGRGRTGGAVRFVGARHTSGNAATAGHAYTDGPLRVTMRIVADATVSVPSLAVTVRSQTGLMLVNADIITEGLVVTLHPGCNEIDFQIEALHLNPGLYLVDLWLGDAVGTAIDWCESAFYLEVVPSPTATLGTTARIDAVVTSTFRVSGPTLVDTTS